jgi:signal transduction histidine kinase
VLGDVPVFHKLWKTGTTPNVTVVTELGDSPAIACVDRDQLGDALRELAVNAFDAMPNGGTLTLATSFAAIEGCEGVRIAVRDTGCGMTDEVMAKCTEPFFSTKPIGKGRGLGLAAVRGFVEQIGGAMAIASTPNGGTEVSLVLPREERTKPRADGARPRL